MKAVYFYLLEECFETLPVTLSNARPDWIEVDFTSCKTLKWKGAALTLSPLVHLLEGAVGGFKSAPWIQHNGNILQIKADIEIKRFQSIHKVLQKWVDLVCKENLSSSEIWGMPKITSPRGFEEASMQEAKAALEKLYQD